MHRTHTCGELTIADLGKEIVLSGWVQKSRDLGAMTFVDIRDRYGITQLVFKADDTQHADALSQLSREYVIKATGKVVERSNKNKKIPTGEIEINVTKLEVLNAAELPPF